MLHTFVFVSFVAGRGTAAKYSESVWRCECVSKIDSFGAFPTIREFKLDPATLMSSACRHHFIGLSSSIGFLRLRTFAADVCGP